MNTNENVKYFDLHTTGIGYLNRVRQVTPEEGTPFLAVTIAAIHGSAANVQHTYFECGVYGEQAQDTVRELKPAVEGESKVSCASEPMPPNEFVRGYCGFSDKYLRTDNEVQRQLPSVHL